MELQAQEKTVRAQLPIERAGLMVTRAHLAEILTPESQADGVTLTGMIKGRLKELKQQRASIVDPLNVGIKGARDHFTSQAAPLEEARDVLEAKLGAYDREQKRLEREEADRIQREKEDAAMKEAEKLEAQGDAAGAEEVIEEAVDAPQPPVHQTGPVYGSFGGTGSTRKGLWDYELETPDDPTCISKVPPEFLELNRGAIRAAVNDGARDIPGLRIFQKEETFKVRT